MRKPLLIGAVVVATIAFVAFGIPAIKGPTCTPLKVWIRLQEPAPGAQARGTARGATIIEDRKYVLDEIRYSVHRDPKEARGDVKFFFVGLSDIGVLSGKTVTFRPLPGGRPEEPPRYLTRIAESNNRSDECSDYGVEAAKAWLRLVDQDPEGWARAVKSGDIAVPAEESDLPTNIEEYQHDAG